MSAILLTPDWLNEQFFLKTFQEELRIKLKEFRLEIKSIEEIKNLSATSTLLRVIVNLIKLNNDETTEYSLIVKYLREFDHDNEYSREIAMYEEILPALEYEWKVRHEKIRFAPKLYRTSREPVKLLVLENLEAGDLDYRIAKNSGDGGLNMAHSKVFLEKLAKYHASTAVYYDKYTTFGEIFDVDYEQCKHEFNKSWNIIYPLFAELFVKHESLKKYATKIENWRDGACNELYSSALKINKSSLNVLNHGECWTNNLLFSYNEQHEVSDVLMLDFQKSEFNSPVFDLFFFLITSTSAEIKQMSLFDELITFYHGELVTYLKRLNYRMHVPTLKELHLEILQRSFLACYITVKSFGLGLVDDAHCGKDFVKQRELVYSDPKFIRDLEVLYNWLDTRGMLDI